ncbi:hypothetical protein BJ165DRAFT_1124307 [Panaeolus papilionaceus]|nr:hypothetical protein BJ165DRAFT_1124307 [Panaeolus papilionaceus]
MLLGAPMNRSYPAIPPYLGSALPSPVPSQTITEPTLWSSSLQIHILFLLQLILIRSSIHHLHSLWGQRSMYANRHKSGLFRNICKLVISLLPFQSSPDHNFHKRPRRFLRSADLAYDSLDVGVQGTQSLRALSPGINSQLSSMTYRCRWVDP